jgi:iron complex outermembrane recepter protein
MINISDEKNNKIQGATAYLKNLSDTNASIKKVLKSKDEFNISEGIQYNLHISSIGKLDFDTSFIAGNNDVFIQIVLKNEFSSMSAVTVVSSKKPLIKEEDDKTIVDAEALTISSTNAFEVIEKTPGAIIDQDGNVYLNSTTPATIFINGREMKLSSADLTSLLKSLPANSVSKIEILRNPSAKYDAASSGGIVNIVLKKGVKLGSSGSVNMSYFQGVYATKTTGFTFSKSGDKLNSYINYQYTDRTNFEELNSDRSFDIDSTIVHQLSFTKYPSITHYINTGLDYAFAKKWNIAYDVRYTFNQNKNKAENAIDVTKQLFPQNLLETQSAITNNNTSDYLSNTVTLKCKIDTSGSEWTNVLDYSYYHYANDQQYTNSYNVPIHTPVFGDGQNDNTKNNFSFQSDLTLKLPKKYTFETGIKIGNSKSQSSANYFIDTNGVRIVDKFQTNTYQYNETISAAYMQLSKTFHGFTIKPGLRFEITDINGHQLIPKDTSFSINRKDIFPYIFLKHKLFKIYNQTLMGSAIFRKSIRRPYYESLNPYPKYVDQFLYESGNPALKPQFTTNYEFNVTFNEIPVFAFGINNTKDIFSNVIYQDPVTKIAYRTFDNLGKNKEYYFRLVGGKPPGGKYFFYMGCVINYNEYRGYYQNEPFNYNRAGYTLFTFHEYKATKKFTLSLQAFMRSKALQNFYELNTFGGIVVTANKSLYKKKVNLIIAINDLLHTNQVTFNFDRNGQHVEGHRINDTRRLGITVRYNFGFKPKEEKEKKNNYEAPQE